MGSYTGAEILVKALRNEGVQHVFGISGHGIDQDFSSADFAKIAKGFGCYAERVESAQDIKPALERAFKSGKPAVLDVKTQLVPHPMFGVMAQVVFQGVPLSKPDGPPPGA